MTKYLATLAMLAFVFTGCAAPEADTSDPMIEEIESLEAEVSTDAPADSVNAENYEEALEELEEEY